MKYLITLSLFFFTITSFGQSSIELYKQAESLYNNDRANQALEKLAVCETSLNSSNAVIEQLRVKCYFELNEYDKAEKALINFFKYRASESLVEEMKDYASKIHTVKIENAKKELQKSKKAALTDFNTLSDNLFTSEMSKINKEIKKIKLSLTQKENDDLIEQDLQFLESLKEGFYYKFKGNKITSSSNEVSYIVFYGNKYVIFTIPNKANLPNLNTNNTGKYFKPSSNLEDETTAVVRYKRVNYFYRKSSFYDNLALSSNEHILWSGKQYQSFDYEIYYFLWGNSLIGDFTMPERFNKDIYTPYIECGRLLKIYNFNMVSKKTRNRLKALGFVNSAISSNKLKVENRQYRNIISLFAYHKNKYSINGRNTAKYIKNGATYKREYLICVPLKTDKGYGLNRYANPNSNFNFTESIGDLLTEKKYEPKESFDILYDVIYKVPYGQNRYWLFLGEGNAGLYNYFNAISKIEELPVAKPKEIKTFHKNGQLKSIGFKDDSGNYVGERKDYYENGKLKEVTNYENGKLNGQIKQYYENGNLKTIGPVKNGSLKGVWKDYFENGNLKRVYWWGPFYVQPTTYKDYYETGKLKQIKKYDKNGGLTEWKMYHQNGNIKLEGLCEEGKLVRILNSKDSNGNDLDKGTLTNGNGTVKMYDDNGNIEDTYTYIDGVKQ